MANLEFIFEEMANLLGCPRDHREMPNEWCDKMCGKVDKSKCWRNYFRISEVHRIAARRNTNALERGLDIRNTNSHHR